MHERSTYNTHSSRAKQSHMQESHIFSRTRHSIPAVVHHDPLRSILILVHPTMKRPSGCVHNTQNLKYSIVFPSKQCRAAIAWLSHIRLLTLRFSALGHSNTPVVVFSRFCFRVLSERVNSKPSPWVCKSDASAHANGQLRSYTAIWRVLLVLRMRHSSSDRLTGSKSAWTPTRDRAYHAMGERTTPIRNEEWCVRAEAPYTCKQWTKMRLWTDCGLH